MQYKRRTQITHKNTKHQRTTFTGVTTNTLNLSYSVTVTKQNKIPILTDDTHYNMTYSSMAEKRFTELYECALRLAMNDQTYSDYFLTYVCVF